MARGGREGGRAVSLSFVSFPPEHGLSSRAQQLVPAANAGQSLVDGTLQDSSAGTHSQSIPSVQGVALDLALSCSFLFLYESGWLGSRASRSSFSRCSRLRFWASLPPW